MIVSVPKGNFDWVTLHTCIHKKHAPSDVINTQWINKCTGVRIPCLLTALFRLRTAKQNQQTQSHNLQPRVVKTVGLTGKISKWQLEQRTPKVLSSFLLQNASVSQTQKDRSTSMEDKLCICCHKIFSRNRYSV